MPTQPENPIPSYIHENIDTIIQAEQAVHRSRSISEVVFEWVGGFIGTMSFVVVQLLGVILWVAINADFAPPIHPFDPFPQS